MLYDLLFRASAETLRTIAADPKHLGAEIGFITILHTWGQNLLHHPHVHCVVPGGGIAPDGERWIACRPGFFLPVRVLSRLFRRLFLEQLRHAFDAGMLRCTAARAAAEPARSPPFSRPPPGRVGRLCEASLWRGRTRTRLSGPLYPSRGHLQQPAAGLRRTRVPSAGKTTGTMPRTDHDAQADEFIRRFLLHVLPDGFKRIRSYGLLANATAQTGSPPAGGCSASWLPRSRIRARGRLP